MIGGSFIGAAGRVADAVVGCLILGVLTNGMQMVGLGVNSQYVVKGILLMAAIGYDTYQQQAKVRGKLSALLGRKNKLIIKRACERTFVFTRPF